MISAAEYGRRCGVAKSRVSAWIAKGMPFSEGKDGHGRACKFIEPADADAWRAASLEPKADGSGRVRGLVEAPAVVPGPEREAKSRAPSEGPALPPAAPTNESALRIQAARAESGELELEMRRTRLAAQQRQLVDRRAAVEVLHGFAGSIANALERMPADAATALAEELGCDQHKAFQALRRVGDRLRDDLARHANADAERLTALGGS